MTESNLSADYVGHALEKVANRGLDIRKPGSVNVAGTRFMSLGGTLQLFGKSLPNTDMAAHALSPISESGNAIDFMQMGEGDQSVFAGFVIPKVTHYSQTRRGIKSSWGYDSPKDLSLIKHHFIWFNPETLRGKGFNYKPSDEEVDVHNALGMVRDWSNLPKMASAGVYTKHNNDQERHGLTSYHERPMSSEEFSQHFPIMMAAQHGGHPHADLKINQLPHGLEAENIITGIKPGGLYLPKGSIHVAHTPGHWSVMHHYGYDPVKETLIHVKSEDAES